MLCPGAAGAEPGTPLGQGFPTSKTKLTIAGDAHLGAGDKTPKQASKYDRLTAKPSLIALKSGISTTGETKTKGLKFSLG